MKTLLRSTFRCRECCGIRTDYMAQIARCFCFPNGGDSGKIVTPQICGTGRPEKRNKVLKLDLNKLVLGALGHTDPPTGRRRESDSCTTAILVERRKGGSDLRFEAARRHERVPVNEARCAPWQF